MLSDLILGAILGCATCCYLFHHFGLINYGLILQLIEGYTKDMLSSNVEKPPEKRAVAESARSPNIVGTGQLENISQRSLRRRKRRNHEVEAKEKNDTFPFNSPVIGEKEPLWSHKYSAKLQAAASNVYQAWREGEGDGWNLSTSNNSGLKVFRKPKDVGLDVIKGVFLIPYPISMILAEINKVESKLKYDANTKEFKYLANYGQGSGLQYMCLKTPSRLVSPRDMTLVFGTCLPVKGGNIIISAGTSVVVDACPPKPGRVRAEINYGGWVFEVKSPGTTLATYLVHIDPKGSIPSWIANQSSENAGKSPFNISKFMNEKHGPYVPKQKSMRRIPVSRQEDDGLIYGSENEMEDSVEDSSEESSGPMTEVGTDTMSSIAMIPLGEGKLTTNQQANIITKLNVTIANVMKSTDSSSKTMWKRTSSKDKGVAIFRRKDDASGYMGKSIVKFEAIKIFNALKEPSFRKAYDPMLKQLQVVEQIGDLNVLHMHHQTKNCMAKIRRDVLVAVRSKQVGKKYVVAGTSIAHPACPENPRMKRVNIGVSGWVVEEYWKQPAHSVVSFVLDIDFGQLPKKVARFVNKRQVMAIHDLAIALKKRDVNGM